MIQSIGIMATSFFQFKKFTVHHHKCAMKVGTDGVLLGAWASVSGKKKITDVGTGSGLIALMLAQRSNAEIQAIDIDASACLQATENIADSIFNNRIQVHHASLAEFAVQHKEQYDLIVSNPPYFKASLLSPVHERNLARHNDSLSLESLIADSLKLLSAQGCIALILPYDQEEELNHLVARHNLFFSRKTYIRPLPNADYKRILAEISIYESQCKQDELTIEESRHKYTKEYINLTKDFYLKM